MACRYFRKISDNEAYCNGGIYPNEYLDPSHYIDHCRGNTGSNDNGCLYFPARTDYCYCTNCGGTLQEDDIRCQTCGSKEF